MGASVSVDHAPGPEPPAHCVVKDPLEDLWALWDFGPLRVSVVFFLCVFLLFGAVAEPLEND